MSTFTVEDKISLLMSNQSQALDFGTCSHIANSHRNWVYDDKNLLAKTNMKLPDMMINAGFHETTNSQKNFNNSGSRATEHHFIKTIYLKKLSADG